MYRTFLTFCQFCCCFNFLWEDLVAQFICIGCGSSIGFGLFLVAVVFCRDDFWCCHVSRCCKSEVIEPQNSEVFSTFSKAHSFSLQLAETLNHSLSNLEFSLLCLKSSKSAGSSIICIFVSFRWNGMSLYENQSSVYGSQVETPDTLAPAAYIKEGSSDAQKHTQPPYSTKGYSNVHDIELASRPVVSSISEANAAHNPLYPLVVYRDPFDDTACPCCCCMTARRGMKLGAFYLFLETISMMREAFGRKRWILGLGIARRSKAGLILIWFLMACAFLIPRGISGRNVGMLSRAIIALVIVLIFFGSELVLQIADGFTDAAIEDWIRFVRVVIAVLITLWMLRVNKHLLAALQN